MDKTGLTDPQIKEGKLLIEALDKANLKVSSAFWLYKGVDDAFKLMIASEHPDLNSSKGYSILGNILIGLPTFSSLEGKIEIIPQNHELIKKLSANFQTGFEISKIRISNTTMDGILFEDVYIYRNRVIPRAG